jgi:hypothetical protein
MVSPKFLRGAVLSGYVVGLDNSILLDRIIGFIAKLTDATAVRACPEPTNLRQVVVFERQSTGAAGPSPGVGASYISRFNSTLFAATAEDAQLCCCGHFLDTEYG